MIYIAKQPNLLPTISQVIEMVKVIAGKMPVKHRMPYDEEVVGDDKFLLNKTESGLFTLKPNGAVGGAAGVIHMASSAVTDCQPNDNVEALRVFMDAAGVEARPVWKPMHKQPVYKNVPAYVNGVSEAVFKVGMCLPAGPCVSDEDVRYIVDTIRENIIG